MYQNSYLPQITQIYTDINMIINDKKIICDNL